MGKTNEKDTPQVTAAHVSNMDLSTVLRGLLRSPP